MRNLTVVGKFLTLMVTSISLAGCMTNHPNQSKSLTTSVTGPYGPATSSVQLGWEFVQDYAYRLSDKQKTKQTHAVYSALESDYGIVHKWFEGNAFGAAKAVHGYPQGSGFCRVIYTTIAVKNRQRAFTDTACKEEGHVGWRFIVK